MVVGGVGGFFFVFGVFFFFFFLEKVGGAVKVSWCLAGWTLSRSKRVFLSLVVRCIPCRCFSMATQTEGPRIQGAG